MAAKESIHAGLVELNITTWNELPRRNPNEVHLVLPRGEEMAALCGWAAAKGFYLCTMAATDERMLEDNVFKLYIVLSSDRPEMVILEQPLEHHSLQYTSIRDHFPAVIPLEQAALDLFGIAPGNAAVDGRRLIHPPCREDLYPLRRNRSPKRLSDLLTERKDGKQANDISLPYGVLNLTVGPIHAGIIEAGQFRFQVAGELIEDMEIRLGYKHRGIEKLFETNYSLVEGCHLAERVSGDSAYAHSLAYCHAVENLAGATLPLTVHCWRGLLLEMERLYNHIGDTAAIVHDIAFDLIASELDVLREQAVRLNHGLTGHRLLRGANLPGGVRIKCPGQLAAVSSQLQTIVDQFLELVVRQVLSNPTCRNRYLSTGVLKDFEASKHGVTGLPARAAGLWQQDFRLCHPSGVYATPELRTELHNMIRHTICDANGGAGESTLPSQSQRRAPVYSNDLNGDVLARLLLRIAEVETAAQIISVLAQHLEAGSTKADCNGERGLDDSVIQRIANFEIGLGYVEGWRGDIFYFLMKGPNGTLFRCQPRDPSIYNWPALRLATVRKPKTDAATQAEGQAYWENILADFPIINKSFNLSYSGNDV